MAFDYTVPVARTTTTTMGLRRSYCFSALFGSNTASKQLAACPRLPAVAVSAQPAPSQSIRWTRKTRRRGWPSTKWTYPSTCSGAAAAKKAADHSKRVVANAAAEERDRKCKSRDVCKTGRRRCTAVHSCGLTVVVALGGVGSALQLKYRPW